MKFTFPSLSICLLTAAFFPSGFLRAQLQPGSGIQLGKTTLLIPSLSASYSWDDNVNLRRRALDEGGDELDADEDSSATFVTGRFNLMLRHWNKSTQFTSNLWYNIDNY